MIRKGITKEKIYQTTIELIVDKRYDQFSRRELVPKLDIKPVTLYSHVKNIEEICISVGEQSIDYEDLVTVFISFVHVAIHVPTRGTTV